MLVQPAEFGKVEPSRLLGLVAGSRVNCMAWDYSAAWEGVTVLPIVAEPALEILNTAEENTPLGFIFLFLFWFLGWLLFGWASLRANVLPRKAAIWVIVGVVLAVLGFVLNLIGNPLSALLLATGLAWMGYTLWSQELSKS